VLTGAGVALAELEALAGEHDPDAGADLALEIRPSEQILERATGRDLEVEAVGWLPL